MLITTIKTIFIKWLSSSWENRVPGNRYARFGGGCMMACHHTAILMKNFSYDNVITGTSSHDPRNDRTNQTVLQSIIHNMNRNAAMQEKW